jgi:hypothetical protein
MLIAETDMETEGQISTYPQACMTYKDSTNTLQPERNRDIIFFLEISQQDAQVTEFILSDNRSTCLGRHYHPSLGAQNNCNYGIW